MEETASNTYEALINHLFSDDIFHTNLPATDLPIFLPEESIQVQCFHADNHQDEIIGTNHKSARNPKPGKIAAYLQQECRPWLKQKPFSDQANPCDEEAKQRPRLRPPALKKKKQQKKKESRALYREVMEEVADRTREAFLKHYGDDSVHVQFQELWKLKMKNKKVKLGCLAGKFPSASAATTLLHDLNPPCERGEECGVGTSTQEMDPQLAPLQTTTSIPLAGQSIQYQCLPACQDGNGRASKSAAYRKLRKFGFCKQQPRRPGLENAGYGFEKAKAKKFKLPRPAKKQQLHQPWLKQKPFDNKDNSGTRVDSSINKIGKRIIFFTDLFIKRYSQENLKNNVNIICLDVGKICDYKAVKLSILFSNP